MPLKEQWILLISTPIYTFVILLEILFSHLKVKGYYSIKETITNIYLSSLNAGLDLVFRIIYVVILLWFFKHRIIDTWSSPLLYWALIFVIEDLAYYWEHRIDHYCRFFWAVHVTHHSSEEYNLTTGFRSSVLQPLYRFVYFIPLAILGFQPIDIIFVYAATQIYGILVHTQFVKKMPRWYEVFLVSPSHHRVHHASNVRYLDKNMGMVLIIWDKIFGTFQEEEDKDPVRFGLTKPLDQPHHPVRIVTHEWEAIIQDIKQPISFTNKFKYIFMPPGWSHDGSRKTANELRRELLEREK